MKLQTEDRINESLKRVIKMEKGKRKGIDGAERTAERKPAGRAKEIVV